MTEVWYYETVNKKDRSKIDGIWGIRANINRHLTHREISAVLRIVAENDKGR